MEAIEEIRKAEEAAEEMQQKAALDAEEIAQKAKDESEQIIDEAKKRGQEYLKVRFFEAEKRIEEMKKTNDEKIGAALKKIEEKACIGQVDILSEVLKILSD